MSPQFHDNPRADLAWLFGESESLFGYRSSFQSMIDALKQGGGSVSKGDDGALVNAGQLSLENEDTMIDGLDARRSMSRLGATTKERRIMRAFRLLTGEQQRALEVFHEPRQLPPDVERIVGPVAKLGALTATAGAVAGYSMAWLEVACSRRAPDARALRIGAEATALLERAVRAYADAARGDSVAALRAALTAAVSA